MQIVETPQGRGHVATLDFQPLGSATKRRCDTRQSNFLSTRDLMSSQPCHLFMAAYLLACAISCRKQHLQVNK